MNTKKTKEKKWADLTKYRVDCWLWSRRNEKKKPPCQNIVVAFPFKKKRVICIRIHSFI